MCTGSCRVSDHSLVDDLVPVGLDEVAADLEAVLVVAALSAAISVVQWRIFQRDWKPTTPKVSPMPVSRASEGAPYTVQLLRHLAIASKTLFVAC